MKNLRQSGSAFLPLVGSLILAMTRLGLATQTTALTVDHESGLCESAFHLVISTPIPGAVIYFATNGTIPTTATGLRYTDAIPILTTTVVRAAAFDKDSAVTEVATRSYLFPAAISKQTGGRLPRVWGTNGDQAIPAHYTMATSAEDTASRTLVEALRAIPSLSLVTDPENLFSAKTGIYVHPSERGTDWERPATVEMFDSHGVSQFQIGCGLRIHGGMSRRPEESPKHSFRLVFKRRYGSAKLHFPLFGQSGTEEFDGLVLRAGSNDSWLDSNGEQRIRAAYVRDEWMRRTMHDIGHPSARGSFVHLYLNGFYWGVYNLCERPDGQMLAARNPDPNTKYDIRKGDEMESGDSAVWDKVMAMANTGFSDERSYRAISQHLDLSQLADYLILNFYAGNSDWDRSANWYAIRPRTTGGKFQFFVWDGERTLEEPEANTIDFDDDESPLRLFHKLSENSTFRTLFAERAKQLLFGNGALSPELSAARFQVIADSLAKPLLAESARWGSYRQTVHQYKTGPYETLTVKSHWRPEVNRILTNYFPHRREILLRQLEERGLFQLPSAQAR